MNAQPKVSRRILVPVTAVVFAAAACAAPAGTQQPTTAQSAPGGSSVPPTATATPGVTGSPSGTTSPGAVGSASSEVSNVTIAGFSFGAPEITVAAGELTFVNTDAVPHTVTEGQNGAAVPGARFDTLVPAGETIAITLAEPGEIQITCQFHPQMQLLVHVE